MKKLFFLLLTLYSLHLSAMTEQKAVFDFTNPLALNITPAITASQLGTDDGLRLNLSNIYTISSGAVSITFPTTTGYSAWIFHYGDNWGIEIPPGGYIKFSVSGGCYLTSVHFQQDNDLSLYYGEPGRWDYVSNVWSAGDAKPTSVMFKNFQNSSIFYQITVKYSSPAVPLTLSSTNPSDGSTVAAFNKLTLSYNTSITKINASQPVLLTGGSIVDSKVLTPSASGSTVTLSLGETINEAGNYKVSVPAGLFETSEGAMNDAIEVNFTIVPNRDTFTPVSVNPASGTSAGTLPKQIKLTFPSYVKTGTGTVRFKQGGVSQFAGTVSVSGKVATISHTHDVTEASSWTVEVPEKMFHNDFPADDVDYRWNPAFSLSYTVDGSQYVTPEPVTVTPTAILSASSIEKGGDPLVLTIGNVKKATLNSEAVPVFKNSAGEAVAFTGTILVKKSDTQFNVNTTGLAADSYSLVMPKGTFTYELGENETINDVELTATFEVQTDENTPQDSETMKAAKALLEIKGVGYPTSESPAYVALKALVNAEETPTDEALQAAIDALYNETVVTMPEVDKWYKIAGVNTAGKMIYLTFNEEKTKVMLGTSANNAAAFQVASVADGKVVFKTKEGFFLHVPMALPMHVGTSDANLTETESDINKLTLAKFLASSVEGADPKALYGMFTIYGSLGTVNGNEEFAYALLNYDNTSISTYAGTPLTFNASMSNAFVLTETSEPTNITNYVYLNVGLRPDAIDNAGDEMLLVIYGPAETTVKDASKIYFMKGEDKVTYSAPILTLTETANVFSVDTKNLEAGVYSIVMEEGAFDFVAPQGKTVKEIKLTATMTVRNGSGGSGSGGGGEVTPDPQTITPTLKLSTTQLENAGDALVLTIEKVKKATLAADAKPVFKYADGEHAGEALAFEGTILTKKSDTEFNVNTTGLTPGKYSLTMPKGTFAYEMYENQVVNDVDLVAHFEIKGSPVVSENFNYTYTSYMYFMPALLDRTGAYYKSTDFNDLIVYVYADRYDGMKANPNKQVVFRPLTVGATTLTGHFEDYPSFAADYASIPELANTYAIRFVPDTPLGEYALANMPGIYTYYCPAETFGDNKYGAWLNGDTGVTPSMCSVNPDLNIGNFVISRNIDDIRTIGASENGNPSTFDLQGRKVENTTKKGIYIINGRKMVIK